MSASSNPVLQRLREGWTQRRQRWALRHRRPTRHVTLHHKNVYIMPTGWGMGLGLMLLTLLLGAINYQSNMGYLLTFLVAASAVSSMFQTHASLRGVSLTVQPLPIAFVDTDLDIPLQLSNTSKQARAALAVQWAAQASEPVWMSAPGQSQQGLTLRWRPGARGWQTLPMVRITSLYPMGLFRAWAVWQPAQTLLVCPSPERMAPPWPMSAVAGGINTPLTRAHDDAAEDVRLYREGDPLKWVLWKKAAKTTPWFRRDPQTPPSSPLWLRSQDTGLSSTNARLRRLTAWVLQAHAQGAHYGVELDAQTRVEPQAGQEQLYRCLQALALWEPGR